MLLASILPGARAAETPAASEGTAMPFKSGMMRCGDEPREISVDVDGADDLHPCYLPDGGIVFASTRCQYGVLCNRGDDFTVKNLYRMDGDGSNMRPLTTSPLSEASPAVLPDGRIIYHRWEYVDKTAGNAKCLWAMNPDGSETSEVYGNTICFPETMIYPRAIPGTTGEINRISICSNRLPSARAVTAVPPDDRASVPAHRRRKDAALSSEQCGEIAARR
jgi:hypothetical protein